MYVAIECNHMSTCHPVVQNGSLTQIESWLLRKLGRQCRRLRPWGQDDPFLRAQVRSQPRKLQVKVNKSPGGASEPVSLLLKWFVSQPLCSFRVSDLTFVCHSLPNIQMRQREIMPAM